MHVHCHHRAVIGEESYLEVLGKMGLDVDVSDPGGCGMAGPFRFEEGQNHDIVAEPLGRPTSRLRGAAAIAGRCALGAAALVVLKAAAGARQH